MNKHESNKSCIERRGNYLIIDIGYMNKNQLQDYLIYEAEYDEEEVLNMDAYELIDKWLRYEGLIGWTDCIISTVKSLIKEL